MIYCIILDVCFLFLFLGGIFVAILRLSHVCSFMDFSRCFLIFRDFSGFFKILRAWPVQLQLWRDRQAKGLSAGAAGVVQPFPASKRPSATVFGG